MQTPEWANLICASFPKTISGQVRYRVLWAPDRIEFCYGKLLRAYPHIGNRWILEVLVPWEKFGPWHEAAFGPKPQDGEFCHSHTIQYSTDGGKTQEFMSLEDFGVDNLRLLITCVERGKMIQAWQMKNHRDAMLEQEDKEWAAKFSDIYDEASGSGLIGGPLGENMTNLNPAKKRSDETVITTLEDLPPSVRAKFACRPGSVKQIS
jgi:hypothetical protein